MLRQMRLILGISIFWLALSMLFDGINTLVLPLQLSELADQNTQATILGLFTFVGLLAGALVQPVAGAFSDQWQPRLGRKGFIALGLLASLVSLALLAIFQTLTGLMLAYLAVQVSASHAQAGQQGLLPDLMDEDRRGLASGFKGFMDITGAMLGFVLLGQLLGSGQPTLAIGAIAVTLVIAYLLAVLLTPEDKTRKDTAPRSFMPLRRVFQLDLVQETAFIRLLLSRFLFLLGIYATGRFLLFFVADRLGLAPDRAAEQAGMLLGGLALITILASPVTGWLADRMGRRPLMIAGSALGGAGALLLIWADSPGKILLFGGLMSVGSAAFAGGSWALIADLVPKDESARYFGLANFSTAGAAAVAGLFGPLIDWVEFIAPGNRFTMLFSAAAITFAASILPIRQTHLKEAEDVREGNRNKGKIRSHDSGLAVLSVPADPPPAEKDQDPPRGAARL
ncbi:MAG TPA: MFS transporter [Anaerolineales bacterium]|nr:MFS transporter [Anaerolineales bacterium]